MSVSSLNSGDPNVFQDHVFIFDNMLKALQLDSMRTTHPILTDVSHPDEIVQLFDAITYKKGSCLIRMMKNFLGEDVLQKGLRVCVRPIQNSADFRLRRLPAELSRAQPSGGRLSAVGQFSKKPIFG